MSEEKRNILNTINSPDYLKKFPEDALIQLCKELREKIMAAIERAKKSEQWNRENGRFIPYPATWLHAQGWEDELEPQNKAKAQTTYNIEAFEKSGAFDDLDWRP